MTKKKIAVIDSYDSFTYNLVYFFRALKAEVNVYRNDRFDLSELHDCDGIVLSPGPGIPSEAGLLMDVIRQYAEVKPILGICLGHQAIAETFGGQLLQLPKVIHGKSTAINILDKDEILFRGFDFSIKAGRYHSWVVDEKTLPNDFVVTACDENSAIMGIRHKKLRIRGLQFHPESFLTPHGDIMLNNWMESL